MLDAQVMVPRTYRQVRRQQCLAMLRAFVRRWGVYLAIAGCVAGIGAPAVAVWSVLPLFWSVVHLPWAALALPLYALFSAGLLWAARPLLWPRAWAEAERALPIPPMQRMVSDAEVVGVALVPLIALFGAGATVLLVQDPAWLRPVRGLAVGTLLLVLAVAAALAVAGLLHWRISALRAGAKWAERALRPDDRSIAWARRDARWALVWTPLWRGPARRTARAALLGGTALAALAATIAVWSAHARWGMAAFVLVALGVVSRVNALSRQELAPLFARGAHLPLSPTTLERARAAVALAPALAGLVLLCAAAAFVETRPALWWAFVTVSGLSWWAEVCMRPHDDTSHGARWLVSLAVGVALGTEAVA